ncbi:hypothetical protein NX059_010459 [Plenodomus lindquistii]|nr:hypothetical protein NX059_010459 [Plenodomus lindquistii]
MSCWRILPLLEQPGDKQLPQLLVKPVFHRDSYKLYLTDLTNIWAEELDLQGIVDRASAEQSPIEVSKHDTAQLAILLDNIKKALISVQDAVCRITRDSHDAITLHTTVALPKPLDSLTWKHHLDKRTPITLKNELILPLLVASHIQHERITDLVSRISDKDRAIHRLLDQYETSNLDLTAAFPSIGSTRAGRKTIKREQAAKHIPALQIFSEDPWREHTGQLKDSNVTTLDLFQEALVHSTPDVPQKLKSEENSNKWWSEVPSKLTALKPISKDRVASAFTAALPLKTASDSSDEETEDEFETHDNFRKRNVPARKGTSPAAQPREPYVKEDQNTDASTESEDEDDLDAPPKSQGQSQSQNWKRPDKLPCAKTPKPVPPAEPEVSQVESTKPTSKCFRIGGRTKPIPDKSPSSSQDQSAATPNVDVLPSRGSVPPSSQLDSQVMNTPKKARRQFKIGGKGKNNDDDPSQCATASPRTNRTRAVLSPTMEPRSSPPPPTAMKEETPMEEIKEETPEEKAARKRAELKRKNEEAAKKQAGQKKKKRF